MTTLETPWRIVRITQTTDGKDQRRVWSHYTTKAIANHVCDGLNIVASPDTRYVVEPVTQ